jgi:hypothetical protein
MSRLGYLALGVEEVQRLNQRMDLDLNLEEIIGLGRTVYDRRRAAHPEDTKVLNPVAMAILDQIVEEREGLGLGLDLDRTRAEGQTSQTAPDPSTTFTSEVSIPRAREATAPGRDPSLSARSTKTHVQIATIEANPA